MGTLTFLVTVLSPYLFGAAALSESLSDRIWNFTLFSLLFHAWATFTRAPGGIIFLLYTAALYTLPLLVVLSPLQTFLFPREAPVSKDSERLEIIEPEAPPQTNGDNGDHKEHGDAADKKGRPIVAEFVPGSS